MSQDKIQKARELVLNYIATHTLSDKLNRAVNEVCRSRPKDPWLFLSDIISEWATDVPMIDRLVAKHGIDCYGKLSLQLQLYGRVSNARPPRFLGMENVFIIPPLHTDDEKSVRLKTESDTMMKKVSEFLSPALRSIRINEQTKIDGELSKLYADGLQQESTSFNIIPTISSLIAVNAAIHSNMPLYTYLSALKHNALNDTQDTESMQTNILPNIMCTLMSSTTRKFPSICIVTTDRLRPMDRISMIGSITDQLIADLESTKQRKVIFDGNNGGIVIEDIECEGVEEILAFVTSAVKKTKYELSRDVSLCLSFTNTNMDKNEDMIGYLYGLLCEHKEIEYLEDPLSSDRNDYKEMYHLLRNKLNGNDMKVMIIGNGLYSSMIESIQNAIKYQLTAGVAVSTKEMFTVSNALTISNMIQELSNDKMELTMVCDNHSDNGVSTYTVDLSVAVNAKILRLSLPNSGKSTNKYNRWLAIAQEIMDHNYDSDDKHTDTVSTNDTESTDVMKDVDKAEDLP